jgi:hypothetical protein
MSAEDMGSGDSNRRSRFAQDLRLSAHREAGTETSRAAIKTPLSEESLSAALGPPALKASDG